MVVLLAMIALLQQAPQPAAAQTTSASNPTFITIPDVGNAAPYPSAINVAGLSGTVTKVTVRLFGISHQFARDIDVLLAGPAGQSVILMADSGGDLTASGINLTFDDAFGPLPPAFGVPLSSGTFRPTNNDDFGSDTFTAPAPAGPYGSALADFNGQNPNGTWNLFVVDDLAGGSGVIVNGWSLTIATQSVQFTSTNYSVDENAGSIAIPVTRTQGSSGAVSVNYTVGGGGSATPGSDYGALSGTLNWASGDTAPKIITVPIIDDGGSDAAVEGDETVNLTLSSPSAGTALGFPSAATLTINDNDTGFSFSAATYSAPESSGVAQITILRQGGSIGAACVNFATSNGSAIAPDDYAATNGQRCWGDGDTTPRFFFVSLVNDGLTEGDQTVNLTLSSPTGDARLLPPFTAVLTIKDFANTNAITIQDATQASPYPSQIFVDGLQGSVTKVTVKLNGLAHPNPDDIDMLLVGPQGQKALLMSDTGGANALAGVDLVFDQAAASALPDAAAIAAGTYQPTDFDAGDGFAGPAPVGPYTADLTVFNGQNPNGLWSLFVIDDSAGSAGSIAGGWSLTIDTAGSLQFSTATSSIDENAGPATITLTRAGGSKGIVCADFATSDGSATTPADYATNSGQSCWADGDIGPKTFNVSIVNDTLAEGDETVILTLSNPTGGAVIGSPNPATLTILDDEVAGSLQFSTAAFSVQEDGGLATITVDRVGGSDGPACVDFATTPGSATPGVHYGTVTGTLCWGDGDTTPKTFTVPIIDNTSVDVPNKTVNLNLSNPTGVATLGTPSAAVLTIIENDSDLAFSSTIYRVSETEGTATITVHRIGGTRGQVCVKYGTSDGSATAPADYAPINSVPLPQLCWADGDIADKSFDIPIVNDGVTEGDETVNLALSDPTGGAQLIGPSSATLTILDFGNTGEIQIRVLGTATPYPSSINVSGLAGNVTKVTVKLYGLSHSFPDDIDMLLVGPTGQSVVLMSDTGGGADISNVDLTFDDSGPALPNSSSITSGTYRPTDFVAGDIYSSPAPVGPYGTTLSGFNNLNPNGTWDLYIVDDAAIDAGSLAGGWSLTIDTAGGLQFSAASYNVSEGAGTATITVNRVGGRTGAVSVQYATSDGTATAPDDYTATSGTLSWNAGDIAPKTFPVTITEDLLIEGSEKVNLGLDSPTGGAAAGGPAQLTIVDNEGPVAFKFSAATYSGGENGGPVTITVQRSGDSTNAFDVTYASSDGSATAGSDYGPVSGTLHWNAGDTADKTFSVPVIDDTIVETNETVHLELVSATGGATLDPPSTATLTIVENDVGLSFCASSYQTSETAGSATISVCRSGSPSGTVGIQYRTSDGTATAPGDYSATTSTLAWADGDLAPKSFDIPIVSDQLTEGPETVNLALDAPSGGAKVVSPGTAALTILDFGATSPINIPVSGTATPYPSQINVSGLIGSVSRVTVSLYGLSHSVPDDIDLLLVGPQGQSVVLMSDTGGSNPVGGVNLTFADSAGAGLPDSGQITGGAYQPTNVGASDSFDPPAPAGPYGAGLAVFNGQNPNGTWKLFVVDDDGSAGAGSIAGGWSLTIDTPGGLRFTAPISVAENGGPATIDVSRVGGSAGAVSVQYATSDGTATAPADYTSTSGTLNWADGDLAPKTFAVSIVNDVDVDAGEALNLTLSNPTGGAALASPSSAPLNILDDDSPGTVQFSAASYSRLENGGTASVEVQRVAGIGGTISVVCQTSNGTAVASADYTATAMTLTWGPGDSASKLCLIPIANDTLNEGDETLNLALNTPSGGATIGTPGTAVLTITDDDPGGNLQFSTTSFDVLESAGVAVVTVKRVNSSGGAVTVRYATSDGSASASSDYVATSGTLTWADGDPSDKTFTVPITNDGVLEGDEIVNLTLSNPTGGAVLGSPITAQLAIHDDDSTPVLQFVQDIYPVAENAGSVTIRVSRLVGGSGVVSVSYVTANSTASTPNDYTSVSGTLTWQNGDMADKTFSVPIVNDSLVEGNELVLLILSNPTGGAVLGRSMAHVLITDDDIAPLGPRVRLPVIMR
jgi:subtilisin-like proprotein convertase family protein